MTYLFFTVPPILAVATWIAIVLFWQFCSRERRLTALSRDDWGRVWADYYASTVHEEAQKEQAAIQAEGVSIWNVQREVMETRRLATLGIMQLRCGKWPSLLTRKAMPIFITSHGQQPD